MKKEIVALFTEKEKVLFSDIEKHLGMRSNNLAYYVKKLVTEGVLEKKENYYYLSPKIEPYIAKVTHFEGENSPLPIILVAITSKNSVVLWKRTKRPYKNKYSLLGGKIRFNETIKEAAIRKAGKILNNTSYKIIQRDVMHERLFNDEKITHNFMLFFVEIQIDSKVELDNSFEWVTLSKLNSIEMIPSDKQLLQKAMKKRVSIKTFDVTEY